MPRNRLSRYKTGIFNNSEGLQIVYHETVIVKRDMQGNVTLTTGGWLSATTKRKINAAIDEFKLFHNYDIGIRQVKGIWYIVKRALPLHYNQDEIVIEWDGKSITLDINGNKIDISCNSA